MEDTLRRIGLIHNRATPDHKGILTRVLKTVMEMLYDRGYTDIQSVSNIDELIEHMQDNRPIVRSPDTIVYFHSEDRVGVKQLRLWAESTEDVVIILSLDGPTSFTRRESEIQFPRVQFFTFRDMSVNITHHNIMSKHEKWTAPLAYDTNAHADLPVLYTNDRVAQYYNYKVGDVVRITRTFGTQEPVFYFRIVGAPPG